MGRDGVVLRRYGIRVVARICFFDESTGMAGRSIHFLTHIGHMFSLISVPIRNFYLHKHLYYRLLIIY